MQYVTADELAHIILQENNIREASRIGMMYRCDATGVATVAMIITLLGALYSLTTGFGSSIFPTAKTVQVVQRCDYYYPQTTVP